MTARSLYGIDGPRRRPTSVAIDADADAAVDAEAVADAVVVVPEAASPDVIEEPAAVGSGHPSVADLWRGESFEIAERRRAAGEVADLEQRFDTLRIELEAALDRRVRVAVDQMQMTFDQEIESLRTLNREEAKRIRSANDEAFVRIRVSNTAELERIKAAIDEGIARLCSMLEGQLDRVWAANDVELERIRSAGADRLAEVHDLLQHKLDQVRSLQKDDPLPGVAPMPEPVRTVEPAPMPEMATDEPDDAGEPAMVRRHWLRRRRAPAAH